jgi:hypothetical protein
MFGLKCTDNRAFRYFANRNWDSADNAWPEGQPTPDAILQNPDSIFWVGGFEGVPEFVAKTVRRCRRRQPKISRFDTSILEVRLFALCSFAKFAG